MRSRRRSKARIQDVARRAGVSIATVSRVLNGAPQVAEPTRTHVLRVIEELKFRPMRTARSLANKHALPSLAIAFPAFTTPFHSELLKGVRRCISAYEVDILAWDLGSQDPNGTLFRFLERGTVDGLLLAGLPCDDDLAQELMTLKAPVVLIGVASKHFDCFYWDDITGAFSAVTHLIKQGHRRIGFIQAHSESMFQDHRLEGYKSALSKAQIAFDAEMVQIGRTRKHGGFSEEAGYEAMQNLLAIQTDPVTAVFACSDVHAIGAIKAIRNAGKRIPNDVALVGYDDIKTSEYIGLTSVDQGMKQVGYTATELLIHRVLGTTQKKQSNRLIKPKLKIRQSSQRQD